VARRKPLPRFPFRPHSFFCSHTLTSNLELRFNVPIHAVMPPAPILSWIFHFFSWVFDGRHRCLQSDLTNVFPSSNSTGLPTIIPELRIAFVLPTRSGLAPIFYWFSFFLFPSGSGLPRRLPRWVMSAPPLVFSSGHSLVRQCGSSPVPPPLLFVVLSFPKTPANPAPPPLSRPFS